jgi:DNA-binding transcriptional ArsR family regulator
LREWRFLTNHGLVFLHKVLKPRDTVREIAMDLGVTERAVHRILRDLEREGYLSKEKVGRRALYRTNAEMAPLSHQLAKNVDVRDLLQELTRSKEPKPEAKASSAPNNGHSLGGAGAVPATSGAAERTAALSGASASGTEAAATASATRNP